ncbi:MAG: Asp-tRNA(Asn)/Glu-tRNA(Gln) amidotransferase GatCAB subunit B, partial [Rhodospirillaceae bacterium]
MAETGKSAKSIVEERGLKQVSDSGELEKILDDIIAGSEEQVVQFKNGNEKIIGWFVGQVMQKTKGQANPTVVNDLLKKKLDK